MLAECLTQGPGVISLGDCGPSEGVKKVHTSPQHDLPRLRPCTLYFGPREYETLNHTHIDGHIMNATWRLGCVSALLGTTKTGPGPGACAKPGRGRPEMDRSEFPCLWEGALLVRYQLGGGALAVLVVGGIFARTCAFRARILARCRLPTGLSPTGRCSSRIHPTHWLGTCNIA